MQLPDYLLVSTVSFIETNKNFHKYISFEVTSFNMIILKLEECPILFLEHNENKSHKIGFHEFFSLFHPSLRTHQHLSRVVGIVLVFYQYKLYAISFEERIAR